MTAPLLTTAEVAAHLRMSASFVRRLVKEGDLDADPYGMIRQDDLERFVASCRETTSVYFIQMEVSRHIKIGIALDVRARLDGLRTGNPERLTILATVLTSAERAKRLERTLHKALSQHRLAGEWFRADAWLDRLLEATRRDNRISEATIRRALL